MQTLAGQSIHPKVIRSLCRFNIGYMLGDAIRMSDASRRKVVTAGNQCISQGSWSVYVMKPPSSKKYPKRFWEKEFYAVHAQICHIRTRASREKKKWLRNTPNYLMQFCTDIHGRGITKTAFVALLLDLLMRNPTVDNKVRTWAPIAQKDWLRPKPNNLRQRGVHGSWKASSRFIYRSCHIALNFVQWSTLDVYRTVILYENPGEIIWTC